MANEIFPNSSRSPSGVIGLGQPVTLTWAATATLGIAYREGTITKPNGQVVNLARVWYPDTPLGPQSFTDTVLPGLYTWRSRYADMSVLQGAANGLLAEYYNGTDLNPASQVFVRTDPNINFEFPANTPPSPGIVSDHYSMRWSGSIIPRFTGNYTFSTLSDDGIRLYVNNVNLISNWTDHGATTDVAPPIFLQANVPVPIVVEFFNNFGPGLLTLYWQSASQNYEVVPQSQLRNNGGAAPTYGTGYKDQDVTFQVGGLNQAVVAISPTSRTIQVGATVNFTGSGGSGTGQLNWGGQASGVGNTRSVQFNTVGTFQVTVYRAGDSTYNQSNTAISTITVTKANQASLVATPASQQGPVGNTVTLTANGGSGTGQYQWGGAVALTTVGNSITFQIPAAGLSQITCKKLADANVNDSNTVTFNVTGVKSAQVAVTISPTPINVQPGTTVLFTAAGGSGTGLYQWDGDASGTGTTKSITFNTLGSRSVTVFRQADATYNQSNTAIAAVTVQVHVITPNSSRSPATRPVGQAFVLTWAATATIGLAYREGTILQPGGSTIGLSRVNSFEPGMLGPQSFTPTAGKGVYTWTAKYADQSINSGPPYTYGTGFVEQQLTFVVTGLSQTAVVATPGPSINVSLGDEVTFDVTGGSGTGNYIWGGDASGGGTSQPVTFNTVGTRHVTVYKEGDDNYADSNTYDVTVTVSKLAQAVVTISPSSIDVEPGTVVEFTAAGGSGTGDFQWGGEASGTGPTQLVLFSTGGTKSVTVKKLEDATYSDSNTAAASIDVAVHIITPNSTRTPASAAFGLPITLRWNATATVGLYFREGSVVKPDGSTVALARVYHYEGGMLGPQAFTDTMQRGVYTWTSRYADMSNVTPPLTYGTGYKDQALTFTINGIAQSALTITPSSVSAFAGGTATFQAPGGSGTGQYRWTIVYPSGTVITLTNDPVLELTGLAAGNITVKVMKLGDFTYNDSNLTSAANLSVTANPQLPVTIDPSAIAVQVGQVVTFNAIGGSGGGNFSWGGSSGATGSGSSKVVQFNAVGTKLVTVKKLADSIYADSNTATATVVVTVVLPPTVTLSANPTEGASPLSTTISWTSQSALAVEVSGPGLASTAFSGSQLITDLGIGVKTYTIKATNAGGTTIATVNVNVDLTPIETTGFTVHFTDQSVLRADTWLWDFGDGSSTSTVRNPTHTYAELGLYLVTLTVTCDGKTDVKQKLINIGCNPADPLPFTPDWNTLVNEEDYDPFLDDPRYVDSDFTSPLGPAASRQSGPANQNWTMCPDVDYCDGPDALDVAQTTRFSRRWKVLIKNGKLFFNQVGLPLIDAPEDMFPLSLNMTGTNYVTLSFDANSAPYFAYQFGTNQVRVHFRVNGTPLRVQFFGETPRLFSEVIINPISSLCDVVLYYVRDGKIYVRFQREAFGVEWELCEPTIYGEELASLTKVDANRNEQRIYLYGKTIGGKRLLFRSGLYPSFPDVDPVIVVVDPEFADNNITLQGGSYGPIETVDFTDQAITLSEVTHARSEEVVAHDVVFTSGTNTRGEDVGLAFTEFRDGTTTPGTDKNLLNVTLLNGTTARNTDTIVETIAIANGTYGAIAEKTVNELAFAGGTVAQSAELSLNLLTLNDGTYARIEDRSTVDLTLSRVDHLFGEERSASRETLEVVTYARGSHSAVVHETLDRVRHVDNTFRADSVETLKSIIHANRTEKARHRETLSAVRHLPGWFGKAVNAVTFSGREVPSDPYAAWTSDTFTGGEYAFGLLTFDNTDSDHFDSTKFTWDLNVGPDDEEIPPL